MTTGDSWRLVARHISALANPLQFGCNSTLVDSVICRLSTNQEFVEGEDTKVSEQLLLSFVFHEEGKSLPDVSVCIAALADLPRLGCNLTLDLKAVELIKKGFFSQ